MNTPIPNVSLLKPSIPISPPTIPIKTTPVTESDVKEILDRLKLEPESFDYKVLHEMATEVVRLSNYLTDADNSTYLRTRPAVKAQIASRRVTALKELSTRADHVIKREQQNKEIQIIGNILRLLQDSLTENGVTDEAREVILQTLMMKIEGEETKRKEEDEKT